MKNFLFILMIVLIVSPLQAQLFINEFMASNDQTIADNNGDYDDWIELYNDYDYEINLSGYYLTDDFEEPTLWACPDVSIPAKSFLIIWADKETEQGELHADFKLSAGGEEIGLYDGTDFVDSLTFGEQSTDISFGRYPDGTENWYLMSEATPGEANGQGFLVAEEPNFSQPGGFYSGYLSVELNVSSSQAKIYYSLDGSDPTEGSLLYVDPIPVNATTPIRARTFEQGYEPSGIVTNTYILDTDFDIASISLVTDPDNLWDSETGIYTNWSERGEDWERPASVEFFEENDDLGFSENIGLRIHGDSSREYDKKPFRLYFRSEYGQSWLNYSVFEVKSHMDEYKRLVVHSGGTDMPGNPYGDGWTLLRDPLMHNLGRKIDLIYAANHPVALFLNGEQWGVYNLIERIDKYYIETNFGETDVDLIENGHSAKEGDMVEWNEMIAFFENHDLSITENYETAQTLIDVDNFTDYNIVEIFGGNEDWPHHNLYAFRPNREDALWRWILWDMDGAFGPYGVNSNTLEWATRDDESTLILRKLLDNQDCEYLFINRYADLLNTTFLPSTVDHLIDSLEAYYKDDISFETDKWGSSPEEWKQEGIDDELHDFANRRPDYCRRHIREEFNISENHELTLNTPQGGSGRVRVNSIYVGNFPWTGIYFDDIPIELEAMPDHGCQFKEWSDPSLPKTPIVSITLTGDYSVYPIFEGSSQAYPIVINEINYNSSSDFDTEDWVELYNDSDNSLNLSGWHFKDDKDENDFTFPDGTTIEARSYLVLCYDQSAFSNLFPGVTNIIGDFGFGLSGGGDDVKIYDASFNLIDSVTYDDDAPWPTEADGNGPTLELIDPGLDNALVENWGASENFGTPGQVNSIASINLITDLRASVEGENILLEWSAAEGVTQYNIYRGTSYDFEPDLTGGTNRIAVSITDEDGGTDGVQWTDTGNGADVVGDVDKNYFYRVTAVTTEEFDPSNLAGEFDYNLVTTTSTNINQLAVLMHTQNTRTPILTAEDLAQAIPYCTDVYKWDAQGQGSIGHVKGVGFNNFDIIPGYPYSVNVTSDTIWTVAGSYSDTSFNLIITDGTDINQLAVPLSKGHLTTAEELGQDIPYCTDVYYWDAEAQGTIGHVVGVGFENFSVRGGYPYKVNVTGNTVWPDYGTGTESLTSYSQLEGMRLNSDKGFLDSNIPHTIYGKLRQPGDAALNSKSLKIRAWITSRPREVLTGENVGIGSEKSYWWIGVSNFATKWEIGDSLIVEITNSENGLRGTALVILSDAGSDDAGEIQLTGTTNVAGVNLSELPKEFTLLQNYPNPFNPETKISYGLPKAAHVTIHIYDISGRLVRTLADGAADAGYHQITWNGQDNYGSMVSSGLYFCKMKSDTFQKTRKLIFTK